MRIILCLLMVVAFSCSKETTPTIDTPPSRPSGWQSYSDQLDEWKYEPQTAPGTLVRVDTVYETVRVRICKNMGSVRRRDVRNPQLVQPARVEFSETFIDKSRQNLLQAILGNIELNDQEKVQFIRQDMMHCSISDSRIDRTKVANKMKQVAEADRNRYYVIVGAVMESYTYKRFELVTRNGAANMPIQVATVYLENATYRQTTEFTNTFGVRLILVEANAFL